MQRLKQKMLHFLKETQASMSVEAVLVFPLLWTVLLASWVFFDAYRAKNINIKAAYTVSDLLSREIDVIDADYLEGLNDILSYLVGKDDGTWLRVTVLSYDEDEDDLELIWSEATGTSNGYTSANYDGIKDQIPVMADGDTAIVLETSSDWTPLVDVGLTSQTYANLVVVSPRFAPQLCFEQC